MAGENGMGMKRQLLLSRGRHIAVAFCAAIVSFTSLNATPSNSGESGWIEGRLERLSLRQKLSQLLMIGIQGRIFTSTLEDQIKWGGFGGVILLSTNLGSEEDVRQLATSMQNRSLMETGVPLFIAVDQEGGEVNRIGSVVGQKSASYPARLVGRLYDYDFVRSSKLIKRESRSLALRMRSIGINMNLAPVLDLSDDSQSFIYQRSYGSSPEKVTIIAKDLVDSMRSAGVIATGKHFPNLSNTKIDSHQDLPVIFRKEAELYHHEWKPFKNLRKDLDALMVGHVLVPEIDPLHPASVSVRVGNVLRSKIGFKGLVITDDLKMGALKNRYSMIEAVLRAFFAGYDIMLGLWDPAEQREIQNALEKAALKNFITEDRINQSLRRILSLKYGLKNFGANGGT